MNLEELVVSKETAEKMVAAGWKTPTVFIHHPTGVRLKKPADSICGIPLWMPTSEEILRELPGKTGNIKVSVGANAVTGLAVYEVICVIRRVVIKVIIDDKLSEAAAYMWLWCVERGYVKP